MNTKPQYTYTEIQRNEDGTEYRAGTFGYTTAAEMVAALWVNIKSTLADGCRPVYGGDEIAIFNPETGSTYVFVIDTIQVPATSRLDVVFGRLTIYRGAADTRNARFSC